MGPAFLVTLDKSETKALRGPKTHAQQQGSSRGLEPSPSWLLSLMLACFSFTKFMLFTIAGNKLGTSLTCAFLTRLGGIRNEKVPARTICDCDEDAKVSVGNHAP